MNRRDFIWSAGVTVAGLTGLPEKLPSARSIAESNAAAGISKLPLLFGTDYYPDQTPEKLWEQDAEMMAAFGVTNVRIAEFAWALMEPQEGKFDFAWLNRAVKILTSHNIAVILGTPSAAPPPWLTQKYPEVMIVNEHGVTLTPGTRRFTCPTNKTYRRLSLSMAAEMAKMFAATAGVIGWQIDNEQTLGDFPRCYCRFCRAGFQEWLKEKYKTLEAINEAWGTVFWSQTYTDFSEIPLPLPSGSVPNPGLALDYDRYQSYANVTFMEEQLAVLRKECPKHFVTTNNVSGPDTINLRDLFRNLDFVSHDNYPGFVSIFMNGPDSGMSLPSGAIAPFISLMHDFMRSVKDGKPYLVMEEQSGKAGQPFFAPQPEAGQLRLWSYQAVAHGAMGINYFRWDTANFGAEEYWHGILRHDRSPSPGFEEIKRTMAELKSLGAEALNAKYDAELALCFDSACDWAFSIQPGQPKVKYFGEIASWYGSIAASHAGVDIVDATKDLSQYKIVFGPAMYIVTAQQAEKIRNFVQGGGTFIAGFRLGVKDEHSRIVDTPLPGLLRDAMGVELIDYQPIYSDTQGVKFAGMLAGTNAECHVWADILEPKQAEVLASYTEGMYAGKAAITSHSFGKGKAIYIGAHLEPADLARVLLTLTAANGVRSGIEASQGVEVTTRRTSGAKWIYLMNHTPKEQTVKITGKFKDVISGTVYSDSVSLDAYGVRVLQPA